MDTDNNAKSLVARHDSILQDFLQHDGDFCKFLPQYSDVEIVLICEENGPISKQNLWNIVQCITKMKNVKQVEITSDTRINMTGPFECLRHAGFNIETCRRKGRDFVSGYETSLIKKKAPELLFSNLLIMSAEVMKGHLRELLSRDATVVKEITIVHYDKRYDEQFYKFLSHYSYVETLEIEGTGLFTDYHLKVIGENLQHLRHLSVEMRGCISDEGISFLTGDEEANCPLLETLEISKARGITNMGVFKIGSRLQNLHSLDIWLNEVERNVLQSIT